MTIKISIPSDIRAALIKKKNPALNCRERTTESMRRMANETLKKAAKAESETYEVKVGSRVIDVKDGDEIAKKSREFLRENFAALALWELGFTRRAAIKNSERCRAEKI